MTIISLYLYLRLSGAKRYLRQGNMRYFKRSDFYGDRLNQFLDDHSVLKSQRYILYDQSENILEAVNHAISGIITSDYTVSNAASENFCVKLEECSRVDTREFIVKYFEEIVKPEYEVFELVSSKESESYRFKRDPVRKYSEYEKSLRVGFGFMIMLAFGSEAFIGIEFTLSTTSLIFESYFERRSPIFYRNYLNTELKDLDPEQCTMYQWLNSHYGDRCGYRRDSVKPFTEKSGSDVSYYYYEYPFEVAARQIFKDSYQRTQSLINLGTHRLFDSAYYWGDFGQIDSFNRILSYRLEPYEINVYDWKDHSETDSSIRRVFWKALGELEYSIQFDLFKLISGWTHLPLGGFARVPTTKIIVSDSDYNSLHEIVLIKHFLIAVPASVSKETMKVLLETFWKQSVDNKSETKEIISN